MRVCPKCSFIDPAYWKHVKFSYHIDSCSLEDFQREYPELSKNLKHGGDITEDKDCFYRLNKMCTFIFRKAKIEWTENSKNPFGAEKYEKFNHQMPRHKINRKLKDDWPDYTFRKVSPNQTKLPEVIKNNE